MKTTTLLACGFLFFTVYGPTYAQGTPTVDKPDNPKITCHIEGIGNDTVQIFYFDFNDYSEYEDGENYDLLVAKEGWFEWTAAEPSYYSININPFALQHISRTRGRVIYHDSRRINIILAPGENAVIEGKFVDGFINYTVKGSPISEDLAVIHHLNRDAILAADSLNMIIDDSYGRPDIQAVFDKRSEFYRQQALTDVGFIESNPGSQTSAVLLMRKHPETYQKYRGLLEENVVNGPFAQRLKDSDAYLEEYLAYLRATEIIKPGTKAPDFTLKDITGNDLSLYDVKGEYIALDFWGTWCGPCMIGMPRMKEYHNKYEGRLTIIGVACDEKEERWKKAVAENGLEWIHVIEDPEDKLSTNYGIGSYPTKIILDSDFNIIEIFIGEGDDFYEELDYLLARE